MNENVRALLLKSDFEQASNVCKESLQEDNQNHEYWYALFLADNKLYSSEFNGEFVNELAFNKACELATEDIKVQYSIDYKVCKNLCGYPEIINIYQYKLLGDLSYFDKLISELNVSEKKIEHEQYLSLLEDLNKLNTKAGYYLAYLIAKIYKNVIKDLEEEIEVSFLEKAAEAGDCNAAYQMALLATNEDDFLDYLDRANFSERGLRLQANYALYNAKFNNVTLDVGDIMSIYNRLIGMNSVYGYEGVLQLYYSLPRKQTEFLNDSTIYEYAEKACELNSNESFFSNYYLDASSTKNFKNHIYCAIEYFIDNSGTSNEVSRIFGLIKEYEKIGKDKFDPLKYELYQYYDENELVNETNDHIKELLDEKNYSHAKFFCDVLQKYGHSDSNVLWGLIKVRLSCNTDSELIACKTKITSVPEYEELDKILDENDKIRDIIRKQQDCIYYDTQREDVLDNHKSYRTKASIIKILIYLGSLVGLVGIYILLGFIDTLNEHAIGTIIMMVLSFIANTLVFISLKGNIDDISDAIDDWMEMNLPEWLAVKFRRIWKVFFYIMFIAGLPLFVLPIILVSTMESEAFNIVYPIIAYTHLFAPIILVLTSIYSSFQGLEEHKNFTINRFNELTGKRNNLTRIENYTITNLYNKAFKPLIIYNIIKVFNYILLGISLLWDGLVALLTAILYVIVVYTWRLIKLAFKAIMLLFYGIWKVIVWIWDMIF